MHVQYISDSSGQTTGVFIPIEEWNALKEKFKGIEDFAVQEWQINEVRERLSSYRKNPDQALDFDATMDDIESDL
jgi:hypothetical protein